MKLHELIHKAIGYAPDPITGTLGGATGGAVVGTVATVTTMHGAGVTVASLVATASTLGVGTTASLIGAVAAPIILPAIGCCAVYGAFFGTANWLKKFK